jgi:FAD/FMN-containing dehydrogenase
MIKQELLVSIVGADNVIDKQTVLEQYASDMSFVNRIKPDCIIKPKNTEEINQIVNLARKTGTPLVPVSSGPPHFRGDTVPSVGGAIIIDLSVERAGGHAYVPLGYC